MKTPTSEGLAVGIENLGESLRAVCMELASSLRQRELGLPETTPRESRPEGPQPTRLPDSPVRQLLTVKQFTEASPAFTEPSVRWLIFNADRNRFDEVIVRVGRRIFIDTEKFEEWLKLPPRERQAKPRP